MMIISFKGLGSTIRGKSPMANCLSYSDLDCMVRKKCKGFLGKVEDFKDSVYSSFYASCTIASKGTLLNVVQLDWYAVFR